MGTSYLNRPYFVEDVVNVVRRLFKGGVEFHDGEIELGPGLSVHHIGGHTAGLQVVRVYIRRGWVVLAADALHFYDNLGGNNPVPVLHNLHDYMTGWQTLERLADSPQHRPRA